MAQSDALVSTLKEVLKQQKITYADIARELDMSEANIKRQFAAGRFTLERIEAICRIMKMELSDLFLLFETSRKRITQLTLEQEKELVKDVSLLLVAVSVRNHLGFSDLVKYFHFSEAECIQFLAKLDRLKIIDLLPNNRIKLRIAEDFRWLPDGPIEQFFEKKLQQPFLKSRFKADNAERLFLFGMLSDTSMQLLISKMQTLEKEFVELLRQDAKLPYEKRHSVGFMLALRPWEAEMFQPLMRK